MCAFTTNILHLLEESNTHKRIVAFQDGCSIMVQELDPILLSEIFVYIGCRCATTFPTRTDLHSSVRKVLFLLSLRLDTLVQEGTLQPDAPRVAENCLRLIQQYHPAGPTSIVPLELAASLWSMKSADSTSSTIPASYDL